MMVMQAVVGVGLPMPGQAAETSAEVSMSQMEKSGLQPQCAKNESLFAKLFIQGIAQTDKTEIDLKTDGVRVQETENPEEEKDVGDTSAISGFMPQLLIMQPPDTEDGLAAQEMVRPENLTKVCTVSQSGQDALAASAAPPSGEIMPSAPEITQGEKEADDLPVAPHNQKERTDAFVVPDMREEPITVPTAPSPETPTAAVFVPNEQLSSAAPSAQNRESIKTEQAPKSVGEPTEHTAFQSNVTENIIKTLESMGEEGKAGQSFGEFLPKEKKTAFAEAASQNAAAAGFLPNSVTMDGSEPIDRGLSVTKALDRFLNDFRGGEATNSEIQIVLEPESLGVLTIMVSHTENGISAKIKSDDREVCAIITEQIQKLVQSMESKGVTVKNVDVVYSAMEQNLSFNQNSLGGREERSSRYSIRPDGKTEALDGTGFFDLWQIPGGNEMSGTVEYRV